MLDPQSADGQAREAANHLPPLRQYHPVDPRHLHDAQLDHTGSTAQVLRTPGMGDHIQDQPAATYILQVYLFKQEQTMFDDLRRGFTEDLQRNG